MKNTHNRSTRAPATFAAGDYCPIPRFVDRSFPDDLDKLQVCDAIRYVRAMRKAAEEYPDAFGFTKGFDSKARDAAIDRVIKKPDFNTLVCEEDGEIVGGISYARPCEGTLELGYIFRHRGVRARAIGRLLIRDGLRLTEAKGDTRVVLSVLPLNVNAVELYESLGFVAEERTSDDPHMATHMELRGKDNILQAVEMLNEQIMAANLGTAGGPNQL